jgi:hypothetical protein
MGCRTSLLMKYSFDLVYCKKLIQKNKISIDEIIKYNRKPVGQYVNTLTK